MDFGKYSKSAKEDCSCCPLFSLLYFSSLLCSFLAYFERLWQRAIEIQSLVLHEFELFIALPWTIYNSPSFLDCFGDQITNKNPKTYTIWLEMIARVLNMLIELKGNNYYSKVFKRINYKLSNSTFWVVIITLLKFFLNEDSTNLKLQLSSQVFTIGFFGSNGHYKQSFKSYPQTWSLKLNLTSINESLRSLNPSTINEEIKGN